MKLRARSRRPLVIPAVLALAAGVLLAPTTSVASAQPSLSALPNDPFQSTAPASSVSILTESSRTPNVTADNRPPTVPAVQQWESGGRDFSLGRGALRVQVDVRYYQQLADDAETFAEDLRALTGRRVVVGRAALTSASPNAPGRPGAIRLTLDDSLSAHGEEASRVAVDGDITVAGSTAAGTFSGTRTVLQLLRGSDPVSGGVAVDWPGYAERSFMIDNGRKYFSVEWTKRQIRELSYLKYNQFHWHLSDNKGFRIESETHPEVLSPEFWTKEQVRELVAYAAKYHIEVIPEIDMPGHMEQALRAHPDLQVVDADGKRYPRNLDPTNPAARALVKELLDELIPLFPGRYIHTGGDEYTSDWDKFPALTQWARQKFGETADIHDAILDFTNWLNGVVRSHDKTMRMWNDGGQAGATQQADRNIVLEYWDDQRTEQTAQDFLDQGFQLVNSNRKVLYGVPSATPTYNNLDPRKIYDQWDMSVWHDAEAPNPTEPHADGILGGQVLIWNDSPDAATQEQVAGLSKMPLRAMSQKLWDSPRPGADWDSLGRSALRVGLEPSWALLDGESQNRALGALAWSSGRERPDCQESALVDGDLTTRWCGPKPDGEVILDLGSSVDLGTVALHWQTAFATGYQLSVSDDLQSWDEVYATTTGDGKLDLLEVSGHGRFLRLSMTERGTIYGFSLWEVAVYPRGAMVPVAFDATVDPQIAVVEKGSTTSSTLTVSNVAASAQTVSWSADLPDGVDAASSHGSLLVPAGSSAQVSIEVSGSTPGTQRVPITVTGESLGQTVKLADAELFVAVPLDDIAAGYNNVGVTSDADVAPPSLGTGLDGAGSSFSAEALAAVGVEPGTAFTVDGVTVTWPDVAPAAANNLVANGQSVAIGDSGSTIGVLATATYGTVTGQWVVHYTDGTVETVTSKTADWGSSGSAGSTVLATTTYRNSAESGRVDRRAKIYLQSIPVDPTKTVAALTLPIGSDKVERAVPAVHVFDVGIG